MIQIEQPFCELTEKAVLSVALDGRHPEAWPMVRETCPTNEFFFVRNHKLIAMCCDALAADGKRIDVQTVATYASSRSYVSAIQELVGKVFPSDYVEDIETGTLLEGIGGFSFLGSIAEASGSVAAMLDNCEALAAFHRRREVIKTCLATAESAATEKSSDTATDSAIVKLASIRNPSKRGGGSISANQTAIAQHDSLAESKLDIPAGVFGIPSLDLYLPLRRGRLLIGSAAPGCGKTSLALMAATNTAKLLGPHSVGFISLEMSAEELATINLAREAGVPKDRLENGRLTNVQRECVRLAQEDMAKNEFFIREDDDSSTVDGVCAWIRQKHIASNGKLHLVCIDYIQLLDAKNARQQEREMLVEASRKLKKLTRQLNICILLLSQMNAAGTKAEHDKNGNLKARPEPRIEDLHGSSTIGKDSDGVVFITSQIADTSNATIPVQFKIAKNRGGREAKFDAEFRRASGQKFVEIRPACDPEKSDVSDRSTRMESVPSESEDVLGGPE